MAKIKNIKIKESFGDRVLNLIIGTILVLFTITVAYPLIYVISCSFSSSAALEAGAVILWPVDVSLEAYEFVMAFKDVWTGFRNSIFYCFVDCMFQMTFTLMVAYPLSRSYCQGRKAYTYFFYILCRFGAGLIPTFILK